MNSSVAVVTGASRGLGKAFSEALLNKGYKVLLCCIDQQEGIKTLSEFKEKFGQDRVDFQHCDVRKEIQLRDVINEAVQKHSRLDIMVNNAGIMNEYQPKDTVDINLTGMMTGTALALNQMQQQGSGLIVNVSSIAGLMPVPFCPAYAASKFGIIAYTRSLALLPEVSRSNIRLTCLCPSFANTDIIKRPQDRCDRLDLAKKVVAMYDIMPVNRVVEAFLRLVDDSTNNGKVMVVTPKLMEYNTFVEPKL